MHVNELLRVNAHVVEIHEQFLLVFVVFFEASEMNSHRNKNLDATSDLEISAKTIAFLFEST